MLEINTKWDESAWFCIFFYITKQGSVSHWLKKCRVSVNHWPDTRNKYKKGQICLILYLFLHHKHGSLGHWPDVGNKYEMGQICLILYLFPNHKQDMAEPEISYQECGRIRNFLVELEVSKIWLNVGCASMWQYVHTIREQCSRIRRFRTLWRYLVRGSRK